MSLITKSKIDPQKYYRDILAQHLRPDGRSLKEFRPVSVNVNSLNNADGSAVVKIGNTTAICGIKAELAKPKADTPNEGYLVPNVELPPLCSSLYQPGPPSDAAQVATRFLYETLTNSNCIDLRDLCIVPDVLAWVLHLDVICLNQDGSLLDACIISAIAALKTVKLPLVSYNSESSEKVVDLKNKKELKINSFPISASFAVFENLILNDPTLEEELFSAGTITVVIRADTGDTCAIHQPGAEPLKSDELQQCISEAQRKTLSVAELVNVAIGGKESPRMGISSETGRK